MDTFMDKLAQKLTAQEMIKANMAADAEEMSKLREKTREYAECLEQMQKLVETGVDRINETQQTTQAQVNAEVQAALEKLDEQLAAQAGLIEEEKKELCGKLDVTGENVHKECVKVYRNVQAVVVDENGKQTENISGAINGLRGRLNAILGFSIAAFIFSVAGIVLQVLNLLNFKF